MKASQLDSQSSEAAIKIKKETIQERFPYQQQ